MWGPCGDVWGVGQPPSIALTRPSHAGQENSRTPSPPIRSGTVTHVRTIMTQAGPETCALAWEREGDPFNPSLKIHSHEESNPGPEES